MSKFNIKDLVYYENDKWYICGIKVKLGYDFVDYEYSICKGDYQDHNPKYWGCKIDWSIKDHIPEFKLYTELEYKTLNKTKIEKEIKALEDKLAELKELI